MKDSVIKIIINLVVGLILAATSGCVTTLNPVSENDLIGKWNLRTIDGGEPSKTIYKAWQLEFTPDGKMSYSGTVYGVLVRGAATFELRGNDLEITLPDKKKRRSKIELKEGRLSFSPDLITKPQDKPVATLYERVVPD